MPPLTAVMAKQAAIPRHRLRSSQYRQLFRGVFVPASEPLDLTTWVAAARLVLPRDAAVSGLTALQLVGLDVGPTLPLHFITTQDLRCRRTGITLQRRTQLPRTPVERRRSAIVEVCRAVGLADAVCIVDRALHLRLIRPDDLEALRTQPIRAVREVCDLARPGAESVRESLVRLCLELAGLPSPRLQAELRDARGRRLGRYDMLIEEYLTLIEYEGDQHRSDKRQWAKDIIRQEAAEALGHQVVRITAEHFRDPWSQVLRVHRALQTQGYRGPAPRRSVRWEEVFGNSRRPSIL